MRTRGHSGASIRKGGIAWGSPFGSFRNEEIEEMMAKEEFWAKLLISYLGRRFGKVTHGQENDGNFILGLPPEIRNKMKKESDKFWLRF